MVGRRVQGLLQGLLVSVTLAVQTPALAQSTPPPPRAAGLLGAALDAAEAGQVAQAMAQVQVLEPVAARLVKWRALRAGHGGLAEYLDFLENHADWPLINTIQRQAERLVATQHPALVLSFFQDRAALSEPGMLAQVFALRDQGRSDEAAALTVQLWREEPLSGEGELQLMRAFETALAPHHEARVDMLLWRGERNAALRHLGRLSAGARAVAEARIALQDRATGVNALVEAVPEEWQTTPGLMHDRFEYRMRVGNTEGAEELILAQSRDPKGLGDADAWGRRRIFLVRSAMSAGDFARAYDLATPNGLQDGLNFVDLEFLAGFIALMHLNDPERALPHFTSLRVRSSSPISLGRAGYWEGRAYEAMGDLNARAAFEFGAEHQTSFYGQMAAEHLGMSLDPALIEGPATPHWRETSLPQSDLLQATMLLREAGQWHEARRFVLALARALGDDEARLSALADYMLEIGEPNFALNIAKVAVQHEIILPRAYFPLTDLRNADLPAPMDLVKAIARRESEFDPAVVSHADARGLMQVLPGTGEMMARRLGVPFDPRDLTRDAALNAQLGAAYLEELRAEFGPSLALVAAGYNAGPGRPRQWIDRLGDPRDPSVDIVTWVESVPFAETRNYIMRVAESLVIYRARLAGSPKPIGMETLLRGQ